MGPNAWLSPSYKTWANPYNSFADSKLHQPLVLDYIFRRTNSENVQVRTSGFDVLTLKSPSNVVKGKKRNVKNIMAKHQCPSIQETIVSLNMTNCPNLDSNGKRSHQMNSIEQTLERNYDSKDMMSLSDHEAITATLRIEKLGNYEIQKLIRIVIILKSFFLTNNQRYITDIL